MRRITNNTTNDMNILTKPKMTRNMRINFASSYLHHNLENHNKAII